MKILNFNWKVLHDSIPVLAILKRRGITNTSNCLLCNEEEETITHLFQQCPFAKAVWHGSILDIRTSEINERTTKQWIIESITTGRVLGQHGMNFLQALFTILWLIWNQRNLVLYQGKTPNPTKVVLTSQSLICKYNEAFQKNQLQPEVGTRLKHSQTLDHQNWQAIIKVATYRNRRSKRCRYAFEAITMDGINLFIEGASSGRQSQHLANQEAVVEAIIKANEIGLSRIIIMCNCRKNIANLQQL